MKQAISDSGINIINSYRKTRNANVDKNVGAALLLSEKEIGNQDDKGNSEANPKPNTSNNKSKKKKKKKNF